MGEADLQLHAFLTWTLHEGEWSISRAGRINRGRNPLRTDLNCLGEEKNVLLQSGFKRRTAQHIVWSLHRLSRADSRVLQASLAQAPKMTVCTYQ